MPAHKTGSAFPPGTFMYSFFEAIDGEGVADYVLDNKAGYQVGVLSRIRKKVHPPSAAHIVDYLGVIGKTLSIVDPDDRPSASKSKRRIRP